MNLTETRYSKFGLVRDMLATAEIIARFDCAQANATTDAIKRVGRLLMTGEGSSRIFPAKHAMRLAGERGWTFPLATEAARQAMEYDLTHWAVFAASNSGKTSEVIKLFQKLSDAGHAHRFGLTTQKNSKLESLSNKTCVLQCGDEGAVAATKSVVAQTLFYHAMLEHLAGHEKLATQRETLAVQVHQALTLTIDTALVRKIINAPTIYFAGRNDGVAEELTLKTNEITRKKSDYLEGTYGAHGIEEVMEAGDVVIWIDPYSDYESKFHDVLVKGVGLTVIAIADRQTSFPTIRIPSSELSSYVQLAAGWNLLVEAGVALGIDLDHPVRARKVGNEFVGQ